MPRQFREGTVSREDRNGMMLGYAVVAYRIDIPEAGQIMISPDVRIIQLPIKRELEEDIWEPEESVNTIWTIEESFQLPLLLAEKKAPVPAEALEALSIIWRSCVPLGLPKKPDRYGILRMVLMAEANVRLMDNLRS